MSGDSPPSKLLLDECYSAEDDRFLTEFQKFDNYEFLLGFVEKWLHDARPWAREQIERYLQLDWNFPGQEVVVKRLFKHFENERDHEMIAKFMVAFDRLVHRRVVRHSRYDWQSRQTWTTESLYAKPNKTIKNETNRFATYTDWRGKKQKYPLPDLVNRPNNRLFSHKTRNYLRRRAWRYFRELSHKKPMAYVAFIASAMRQYVEQDFESGVNILDNWSLMHACYFHHDALHFTQSHTNLVEGSALSELTPAPYQPSAWQTPKGALALVELIDEAKSTLVRLWAMELLRRDHQAAINDIDVETLIKMLSHVDPRVQEFASELFQHHDGLSSLRIETWLELLDQSNPLVLNLICDAMRKHVAADRLDTGQMIELACARPVPVARLGFEMIQQRHVERRFSPHELGRLASCMCESLAAEIGGWAIAQTGTPGEYQLDIVIEFFDSLMKPMRAVAMSWLESPDSLGYNDPALWARLIETPFDDVKLQLVENLERRAAVPGGSADDLSQLWAAVILGVHRGGRSKLKAIRQVSDAIANDPRRADGLLPVMAVAMRSIRAPERRQALSAIATMAAREPQLSEAIASHLPDLQWGSTA